MYVCMYVCLYVCIYVYIHKCWLPISGCICVCMCMWVYISLHASVSEPIHILYDRQYDLCLLVEGYAVQDRNSVRATENASFPVHSYELSAESRVPQR